MLPIFDLFLGGGGLGLAVLAVLTWIAYARLSSIEDPAARWVAALDTPWVMKAGVGIALGVWIWCFGRLFAGDAYLRGAGAFAELSTAIACLFLTAAGVAWWAAGSGRPLRPWLTHGLVLAAILAPGPLVLPAPEVDLAQGADARHAVAFVQGRLAHLGCFEAVGEPPRRDGTYETLTAGAVIAFQQANGLIRDPRLDSPGVVRPAPELRLLARPFPFLLGPRACPTSR